MRHGPNTQAGIGSETPAGPARRLGGGLTALSLTVKALADDALGEHPADLGLLHLRLAFNPGVAFSLGDRLPSEVIVAITTAITLGVLVVAWRTAQSLTAAGVAGFACCSRRRCLESRRPRRRRRGHRLLPHRLVSDVQPPRRPHHHRRSPAPAQHTSPRQPEQDGRHRTAPAVLTRIATAVGLFIATNLDDIVILPVLFAASTRCGLRARSIVAGQHLGFTAMVALSTIASRPKSSWTRARPAAAAWSATARTQGKVPAWRGDQDVTSTELLRRRAPLRQTATTPRDDMNWISSALQAIGLLFVTNIDDIIVLSLFFARGAGQRRTTTKIIAGQYLGFGAILLASVAVTFGAGLFLPDAAIAYFGLIPLLLGLYAAWQVWRNGDDDDDTIAESRSAP